MLVVIRRLLLVLLLLTFPARAHSQDARPRGVLILVPGITAREFLDQLQTEDWQQLRDQSAFTLVNPATTGEDTPEAAYLTLGAGRRLFARSPMPPGKFWPGDDAPISALDPTIGRATAPEIRSWLQITPKTPPEKIPGRLTEALTAARLRVGYIGALAEKGTELRGLGLLTAINPAGMIDLAAVPANRGQYPADWAEARIGPLEDADLVIADLPFNTPVDFALEVANDFAALLDPEIDFVWLVSPSPGEPSGDQWTNLAPALFWGKRWAGASVTSSTTRGRSLIANVDLAPTLLAHYGLPPAATMEGHAATPVRGGSLDATSRLERHAWSTRAAMVPGLVTWGIVALCAAAWGTWVLLRESRTWQTELFSGLASLTFAGPTAMLIAAVIPVRTPGELLARFAALTGGIALFGGLGRRWATPLTVLLMVLAGVALADLYTGGIMLERNLMSDMPNIGARFYGIGNEYQGILMGSLLLAPFLILERLERQPGFKLVVGFFAIAWVAALIAVGSPSLGADFGGALSLAIGCMTAAAMLWSVRTGRRVRLGFVLAGLALVGVFAVALIAMDLARPPAMRTHVGELAARALDGGWGAVARIAIGKALLNAQMVVTPYFLGGLVAVAPVLAVCYHRLGGRIRAVCRQRPYLRAGLLSAQTGAVAAMLLNDTGVIAWGLATAGCLLVLLEALLSELPMSDYQLPMDSGTRQLAAGDR